MEEINCRSTCHSQFGRNSLLGVEHSSAMRLRARGVGVIMGGHGLPAPILSPRVPVWEWPCGLPPSPRSAKMPPAFSRANIRLAVTC